MDRIRHNRRVRMLGRNIRVAVGRNHQQRQRRQPQPLQRLQQDEQQQRQQQQQREEPQHQLQLPDFPPLQPRRLFEDLLDGGSDDDDLWDLETVWGSPIQVNEVSSTTSDCKFNFL